MTDLDLYKFPAKPAIYKGIPMRSGHEVTIARAFDAIGLSWSYEPSRFADNRAYYTPDFLIAIEVIGLDELGPKRSPVYVEAKPFMDDERMRRKVVQKAQVLEQSTDDPLVVVGLQELHASLAGWLISGDGSAIPAAITRRRKYEITGFTTYEEPSLYIGRYAEVWLDGFNAASLDDLVLPNYRDFG